VAEHLQCSRPCSFPVRIGRRRNRQRGRRAVFSSTSQHVAQRPPSTESSTGPSNAARRTAIRRVCVRKSSPTRAPPKASLRIQAWAEPEPRVSYPNWPTRDFGRLAPLDAQQQCIDLSAHPPAGILSHRPHTRSLRHSPNSRRVLVTTLLIPFT
jgi:hypothetical protein